jgi:ferrochelatase
MTGLLLVNLGTPDGPSTGEVRRYLAEFLADPRVIDINPIARWLLLNLIILPFRPAKSAEAYRAIWSEEGSPLLIHSKALATEVQKRLDDQFRVELAMRYGNPSLRDGFASLRKQGCDRIVVFPLYPHYASSSTGSTLDAIYRESAKVWNAPYLTIVPPFYDDPRFIDAFGRVAAATLQDFSADHTIFSFHGLPERQIIKSDDSGSHCLREGCCDRIGVANRNCYRAQCYATARALATVLDLSPDVYSVSFQSRLGRTPWIQPHTDVLVRELAQQGKKRLAVFSPAFVADCLETLEEIGIRAAEDFRAHGGEELRLIPSLNATPAWADTVVTIVKETLGIA